MKVAYDPQIFLEQEFGGISRYFVELATHLARRAGYEIAIVAPLHRNAYLEDPTVAPLVRGRRVHSHRLRKFHRTLALLNRVLAARAWREGFDLIHETYFSQRPLGYAQRRVLTVYDMIHELFPQDVRHAAQVSAAKRAAVARADHVLCISETTRRDLLRLFGTPAERTSVVYLGHSLLGESPAPRTQPTGEGRPYLLFVGLRKAYKNFDVVARAFAASARLQRDFDLLAFGGGAFSGRERERLTELGVAERVRHQSGEDRQLADAYRGARLFVYPSAYEGFGLPPLEAMHLGCPVACSALGSIPEVVGQAGRYFDPAHVDEVRLAMEALAYDEPLRQQLASAGQVRAARFSWEQCAAQTAAVYESLR